MATNTKIAWTDKVWNIVTGCTKISTGCANCYAKTVHDMRHHALLKGANLPFQYTEPFEKIMLHPERITKLEGTHYQHSIRKIFVNSMSDLFHVDVPFDFIRRLYRTMLRPQRYAFQILTKRPLIMKAFYDWMKMELEVIEQFSMESHKWRYYQERIWLGVSAENQETADTRIPILLDTPAAIRWVSIEPMLEEMDIQVYLGNYHSCDGYVPKQLDWVVVGCESGKNRRPCKIEWIESIVDQCKDAGVPVFVNQIEIGGKVVKDVKKFPEHLRIQEFPR